MKHFGDMEISLTKSRSDLEIDSKYRDKIVESLSDLVTRPFWNLDIASLGDLLNFALTFDQITEIKILDDKKSVFSSVANSNSKGTKMIKKDLINKGNKFGQLIVVFK